MSWRICLVVVHLIWRRILDAIRDCYIGHYYTHESGELVMTLPEVKCLFEVFWVGVMYWNFLKSTIGMFWIFFACFSGDHSQGLRVGMTREWYSILRSGFYSSDWRFPDLESILLELCWRVGYDSLSQLDSWLDSKCATVFVGGLSISTIGRGLCIPFYLWYNTEANEI